MKQVAFQWEQLTDPRWEGVFWIMRAKVPGGWFVQMGDQAESFFYPDPEHEWEGNSLP
jgi:hypothetical protein